jgi:micrococcal nuclease
MNYEYNARITKVIDGDTVEVDIDLGFNTILANQSVRLLGIDTPESRTSDKIEKVFGLLSKEFVKKFVSECEDGWVVIRTHKSDDTEKFGRVLAEIINSKTSKNLNEELIKNGYAVRYMGENKKVVADLHMLNRKRLIEEGVVKLSLKEAGIQ